MVLNLTLFSFLPPFFPHFPLCLPSSFFLHTLPLPLSLSSPRLLDLFPLFSSLPPFCLPSVLLVLFSLISSLFPLSPPFPRLRPFMFLHSSLSLSSPIFLCLFPLSSFTLPLTCFLSLLLLFSHSSSSLSSPLSYPPLSLSFLSSDYTRKFNLGR